MQSMFQIEEMNSFIQKCKETGEEMKFIASENIQKVKNMTGSNLTADDKNKLLEWKSSEKSRQQSNASNSNYSMASSSSCHSKSFSKVQSRIVLKMLQAKSTFFCQPKSEDQHCLSSSFEVTETSSISGSLSD
ncbi:orph-K4 [Microplitis demolitor]|uniref:hypothetical protein n=1 Tax=Microplitis demolitor TaxID=69319 RepID=UPI00044002B4|nr:hypothetical protein [Microplitis demolitor]KAG6558486.1 orph-K4 [Microplitis demolitor]